MGYIRGPCCYQAMSKLIIVKSMVGTYEYTHYISYFTEHNRDDEPHD